MAALNKPAAIRNCDRDKFKTLYFTRPSSQFRMEVIRYNGSEIESRTGRWLSACFCHQPLRDRHGVDHIGGIRRKCKSHEWKLHSSTDGMTCIQLFSGRDKPLKWGGFNDTEMLEGCLHGSYVWGFLLLFCRRVETLS